MSSLRIILSLGAALFTALISICILDLLTGGSRGFDYHDAVIVGPMFFATSVFAGLMLKFRWWEMLAPVIIPIVLVFVLPYSWVKIGVALAFVCPILIASIIIFIRDRFP